MSTGAIVDLAWLSSGFMIKADAYFTFFPLHMEHLSLCFAAGDEGWIQRESGMCSSYLLQ